MIVIANYCFSTAEGPFVSALLNSVDFRMITIIGSVISSIAFISAAYVNSLYQLMFCYGFVGGKSRFLLGHYDKQLFRQMVRAVLSL